MIHTACQDDTSEDESDDEEEDKDSEETSDLRGSGCSTKTSTTDDYESDSDEECEECVECTICCELQDEFDEECRCEICKFICCDECHEKIESNTCPVCKNPQYKLYHPETMFTSDTDLIEDIANHVNMILAQGYQEQLMEYQRQYQQNMLELIAHMEELKDQLHEKETIIQKIKKEKKDREKVKCQCGKEIYQQNYKKHLKSKFHNSKIKI